MQYNDLIEDTKDLNILYVEDEIGLREGIEKTLFCLFKNVVSSKNGEEAFLEYTKNDKNYFDIVLTDINMPIIDGIDLIKKIDEINYDQVIIVISAYNEADRLINLINLGITYFIHKPFSRKQFIEVFKKASNYIQLKKSKAQLLIDKEMYEYKKNLLEYKSNSINELLENIAHHWRQPLSIISTIASSMQLEQELGISCTVKNEKSIQRILDTTMSLSNTINNFNNSLKHTNEKVHFNIQDTLETVLYLMKSKLDDKSIAVIHNIENIEIYLIESQFQQILINILNNAIDATDSIINEEKKFIFVNIAKKENTVNIEIKDNGIGIEPNNLNKLCEPYFTTKHKFRGTGLGLFIVNDFVIKEMHGTLEFSNVEYSYESISYSGALVKITMPIKF